VSEDTKKKTSRRMDRVLGKGDQTTAKGQVLNVRKREYHICHKRGGSLN